MGIIVPNMGIKRSARRRGLADALFTPVQQRVLALLFGQPARRFQSAELIRLAQGGTGAVHRQLTRLSAAGLITVTRSGNQKYYQARPDSPVFDELHGLVVKTVAIVEPLRRALAPLTHEIHAAFVYGSLAAGTDRAASDVDLMVLSAAVRHADLYEILQAAEAELARSVNPTLLTPTEWRAKRAAPDSFAARVATAPRVFVIGSDHDLA
jgi:predicted nucleotidyltransferase